MPDQFPVTDAHPRRAVRPYGVSKRLGEDLCETFTERTGVATVVLRPVAVWSAETYGRIEAARAADPASEGHPYWEYGAFVDVRDVAEAVARAVRVPLAGHHRALLCAQEISGSAPSLELAARFAPQVPIVDRSRFARRPRAALIDCAVARDLLGWVPRFGADGQARPDRAEAAG